MAKQKTLGVDFQSSASYYQIDMFEILGLSGVHEDDSPKKKRRKSKSKKSKAVINFDVNYPVWWDGLVLVPSNVKGVRYWGFVQPDHELALSYLAHLKRSTTMLYSSLVNDILRIFARIVFLYITTFYLSVQSYLYQIVLNRTPMFVVRG